MISHDAVLKKYQAEIDYCNESYAQYEKVKKFKLLPNAWTIEGGELTAKLSMKRRVIMERNITAVEDIYAKE